MIKIERWKTWFNDLINLNSYETCSTQICNAQSLVDATLSRPHRERFTKRCNPHVRLASESVRPFFPWIYSNFYRLPIYSKTGKQTSISAVSGTLRWWILGCV